MKTICSTIWEQRIWHSSGEGDGIGPLGLVCTNTSAETPSLRPNSCIFRCIKYSSHPSLKLSSNLSCCCSETFWVGLPFSNYTAAHLLTKRQISSNAKFPMWNRDCCNVIWIPVEIAFYKWTSFHCWTQPWLHHRNTNKGTFFVSCNNEFVANCFWFQQTSNLYTFDMNVKQTMTNTFHPQNWYSSG